MFLFCLVFAMSSSFFSYCYGVPRSLRTRHISHTRHTQFYAPTMASKKEFGLYPALILRQFLLCLCVRLFICALWSPAGKGLASWLSFVVSNCEFVTFPLVSWVRCGTWLYLFLIFAPLLTFIFWGIWEEADLILRIWRAKEKILSGSWGICFQGFGEINALFLGIKGAQHPLGASHMCLETTQMPLNNAITF